MIHDTVQALNALIQTIARESGEGNVSNEMKSSLQACVESLRRVEEQLPLTLNRNKILLTYLQKFDDGFKKCQAWLNEAKKLIGGYSIQVPVRRIEEWLEQNRVSAFSRAERGSHRTVSPRISSLKRIHMAHWSKLLHDWWKP